MFVKKRGAQGVYITSALQWLGDNSFQTPATALFVQRIVETNSKESIKIAVHQ